MRNETFPYNTSHFTTSNIVRIIEVRSTMRALLLFLSLLALCLVAARADDGAKSLETADRIVDGIAVKGAYPNVVYFTLNPPFAFLPSCTGTLVSPNQVLTTAYCAQWKVGRPVVINAWNVNNPESDVIRRRVASVLVIPNYNEATQMHDIAIVTLNETVNNVKPMDLISSNYSLVDGQLAQALGWRFFGDFGWEVENPLQVVNLVKQDPSLCAAAFNNANLKRGYHVCLQSPGIASCDIEFGGPILSGGFLMGVNSLQTCMNGKYTVASTWIQPYLIWIQRNLNAGTSGPSASASTAAAPAPGVGYGSGAGGTLFAG